MPLNSKLNQPREKLSLEGVDCLSLDELVAVLLETGTKTESVQLLAKRFIMRFRGTSEIQQASVTEFQKIKGIGPAKACKLAAAIELGRRIHKEQQGKERLTIRTPEQAALLVMPELRFLHQEHFHCLFLNTKNHLLHRETLFIGSLNMSVVHPREIFRTALKVSAASVLCFHNHPSGDPTPSKEDISATKRIQESGKIVGIELLDHIIIAKDKYLSLKEQCYF
ncbi:DNA repair protein RadC [Listeria aquatica]|uniref:DNA repair protein RadC n=1 Tax=Listeria aquatica TaxID=1494960 RepID=A0A841ZP12_9LIST|nr:DNA repair protein RadC [Listeria aquatica]MBC1520905.1 DNA repair protein RadC [Listeria aquatica]